VIADALRPHARLHRRSRGGRRAALPGQPGDCLRASGDRNDHFNVQPLEGGDAQAWLENDGPRVSAFVHDLVGEGQGSISAEHGIGQMKRDEYLRTADPARLSAQSALKGRWIPQGS
jgi:FAD/FMN-containing dehydrogenase